MKMTGAPGKMGKIMEMMMGEGGESDTKCPHCGKECPNCKGKSDEENYDEESSDSGEDCCPECGKSLEDDEPIDETVGAPKKGMSFMLAMSKAKKKS